MATDVFALLSEAKRQRCKLLRWHQVSNNLKQPTGRSEDVKCKLSKA